MEKFRYITNNLIIIKSVLNNTTYYYPKVILLIYGYLSRFIKLLYIIISIILITNCYNFIVLKPYIRYL